MPAERERKSFDPKGRSEKKNRGFSRTYKSIKCWPLQTSFKAVNRHFFRAFRPSFVPVSLSYFALSLLCCFVPWTHTQSREAPPPPPLPTTLQLIPVLYMGQFHSFMISALLSNTGKMGFGQLYSAHPRHDNDNKLLLLALMTFPQPQTEHLRHCLACQTTFEASTLLPQTDVKFAC